MALPKLPASASGAILDWWVEHSPDAVFLIDDQGRIVIANQQASALFGYGPGELEGQRVEILVPEGRRTHHEEQRANYAGSPSVRGMGRGLALFGQKKDGTTLPVDISLGPIDIGRGAWTMAVVRDMSEFQLQRQQLEALNDTKNQFLGMAAHDLRNPLGNVAGFAGMLLKGKFGSLTEKQTLFLDKIQTLSQHMLTMVEDLLDYSKIESGKLELRVEPTDVVMLVRRSMELFELQAAQKGVELLLEVEESGPSRAWIDSGKMEQVLGNLVSNAIKYSNTGTKTTVRVSGTDGALVIEVKDQGQGIPREELSLLFKPFEKTSVRSTAGEKSTGLGLTIVDRIVSAHGGAIEVDSEVGGGTQFRLTIPRDRRETS